VVSHLKNIIFWTKLLYVSREWSRRLVICTRILSGFDSVFFIIKYVCIVMPCFCFKIGKIVFELCSCFIKILPYCRGYFYLSSFVQVFPKYLDVKNPQKCALVFNAKNIVRKKCRGHDKIFPSDPSLLATVRTFIISYRITYDYVGPRC
jgi:hypothetical protein